MTKIAFYCTRTHPKYKEAYDIAQDLAAQLLSDLELSDKKNHLILDSYDAVFCWFEAKDEGNRAEDNLMHQDQKHVEVGNNKFFLAILDKTSHYKKCIYIDYVNRVISGQKTYTFTKQDPLVKAMGISKLEAKLCLDSAENDLKINILDGTAGLTRDSFGLITSVAGANIKITLLEQSRPIYYLIRDALERLGDSENPDDRKLRQQLEVFHADLLSYLQNNFGLAGYYDIIYLDPMFYLDTEAKVKTKSQAKSKPNKNMQLLQGLCFNPSNTQDLIEKSLQYAKYKVVLKRSHSEDKLYQKLINYSVDTKQIRYDVYLSQP